MKAERKAPRRLHGLIVLLGLVVATARRAAAEDAGDDRFRLLERQLKEAQRQISELQAAQKHGRSGRAVGRRSDSTANGTHDSAPESGERSRSDQTVLLLLDVLHERGAISESDYSTLRQAFIAKTPRAGAGVTEGKVPSVTPSSDETPGSPIAKATKNKKRGVPVSASYAIGKGLTLRSDGGWFEASISNQIQVGYEYVSQGNPAVDDTSSFDVSRMKTRIRGYAFDPSLRYQLSVSYAGRPTLQDAFLRWRPRPYFGLQGGQYIVPFDRERMTSSRYLQFISRTSADEFFAFGYDQGVNVNGHWFGPKSNRLAWSLGIYNGNGSNQSHNENTGHLGVARLLYMPLGRFNYYSESDVEYTRTPRFGIGVAYAFNSQAAGIPKTKTRILQDNRLGQYFGTEYVDQFDVSQAEADVVVKYRGFSLFGDYYWAEASPNAVTVSSIAAQGYDVQAGYFLIPRRLEAAFRYAFTDRDMDVPQSGLREIGGALGYFVLAHKLKLQMEVRDLLDEAPHGKTQDSMEYRMQLQAIF